MKYYTKDDINKMMQNEKKKIVFVNNNIYDVTNFVHPFGIVPFDSNNKIGTDVSIDYNFHSNSSKKKWDEYKIGELYNKNNFCIIT